MTEVTPERITATREALGLSRLELANILGTTRTTVNRWEWGMSFPKVGPYREALETWLEDAEKHPEKYIGSKPRLIRVEFTVPEAKAVEQCIHLCRDGHYGEEAMTARAKLQAAMERRQKRKETT